MGIYAQDFCLDLQEKSEMAAQAVSTGFVLLGHRLLGMWDVYLETGLNPGISHFKVLFSA